MGAGAADHLSAPAGDNLDVVNRGAERDGLERESVAHGRLGALPGAYFGPHGETDRGQDVSLLAVLVLQEGDAGRAVRVVFDGEDLGENSLLLALEIDKTVLSLMAPAAMPHGKATVVVATAGPLSSRRERLFRPVLGNLGKVGKRLEAARGGKGAEAFESHSA